MIKLTPRAYGANMKWAISPQNVIDTVTMSPILNVVATDPSEFHVEPFTAANVGSTRYDLPVANTLAPTHRRVLYNGKKTWFGLGYEEYAKSRTDIVMATGERQFTLEVPVDGLPNVNIRLKGTSSIYARGGGTYDNFPSVAQMQDNNFSIAQWIKDRETSKQESLTWLYDTSSFSTNPWVRNIIPPEDREKATANDIYTNWFDLNDNASASALTDSWTNEATYTLSSSNMVQACPYPLVDPKWEYSWGQYLKLYDDRVSISVSINRLNKYTYSVKWEAPVRFAYMAASRFFGPFGGEYAIDNWAFVDNMTSVDVVLIGRPYNTDDVSLSYSLDEAGNITENTKNKWVNKIDKSEAITMNSTLGGADWKTTMASLLLNKYAKGKYLVTCEVPAMWALQNGVHINTEMQIVMQNGDYIKRNTNICTFAVKTIEKRFNNNAFSYSLGLMEV